MQESIKHIYKDVYYEKESHMFLYMLNSVLVINLGGTPSRKSGKLEKIHEKKIFYLSYTKID